MNNRVEPIAQVSSKLAVVKHGPLRDVAKVGSRETASDLWRATQLMAGSAPTAVDGLMFEDQSQASRGL